ncbi:hypothetical protein KAI65_05255 [Candidatus Parcubacteria bacterium]|nr:hypothetical protein [Candidatus Parcubacteria bacterium]
MKTSKKAFFLLLAFFWIFTVFINTQNIAIADSNLWDLQKDSGMGAGSEEIGEVFEGAGGEPRDLRDIVVSGVVIFLGLLGLFFTVLIILAGFRWMNSRGNEEEITKAKSQLKGAIIGMIIVIAAYAIAQFVITFTEDTIEGYLYF